MLTAEGNINFPKLSPSPTHPARSHLLPALPGQASRRAPLPAASRALNEDDEDEEEYAAAPRAEPLSFEQALAMGRGVMVGRQLPSPMPNGFKPGPVDPASADRARIGERRANQPAPGRSHTRGVDGRSDSDDDWC